MLRRFVAFVANENLFLLTSLHYLCNIKTESKSNKVAAKAVSKKYPNLVEPLLTRHIAYNETVAYCEELERQGKAVLLRPAGDAIIDSFEKDINRIETSYQYGYQLVKERITEIRALFEV